MTEENLLTLSARLTIKDELKPVLQEMGHRFQAIKSLLCMANEELQELAQLFRDNLSLLVDIQPGESVVDLSTPEPL